MESFEELSVSVKITGFINMAIKKEISWKTLSIVVKDLTSTHEKAQNVVNILLKIIKSKFQMDPNEKEVSTITPDEEKSIQIEPVSVFENTERLESGAENREFVCPNCDQIFVGLINYEKHMQNELYTFVAVILKMMK